jgi:hypothetical protein
MSIIHLLYSSTPVIPIGTQEVIDILEAAQAKNRMHGVTGLLAFSGSAFLQIREGKELDVDETFANKRRPEASPRELLEQLAQRRARFRPGRWASPALSHSEEIWSNDIRRWGR